MSFSNWKRRLAGEKITAYLQPQLEDEGYYCIDNLPVRLFKSFVDLIGKSDEKFKGVVIDQPVGIADRHAAPTAETQAVVVEAEAHIRRA